MSRKAATLSPGTERNSANPHTLLGNSKLSLEPLWTRHGSELDPSVATAVPLLRSVSGIPTFSQSDSVIAEDLDGQPPSLRPSAALFQQPNRLKPSNKGPTVNISPRRLIDFGFFKQLLKVCRGHIKNLLQLISTNPPLVSRYVSSSRCLWIYMWILCGRCFSALQRLNAFLVQCNSQHVELVRISQLPDLLRNQ